MAKKSDVPTGSTAKAEATPKPKLPEVPIPAKDLAKLIANKDSDIPPFMVVDWRRKAITITFEGEVVHVLNTLNKYTNELRSAFQMASLPHWKAIFMANGKRFVSTL